MPQEPDPREVESLLNERQKFVDRLGCIESEFFDSLFAILTDQQKEFLPIARSDRARQLFGGIVYSSAVCPEARIDLVEFVEDLHIPQEENEPVLPILMDYTQTLAPRLIDMARKAEEVAKKDRYLVAQLNELKEPSQRATIGAALLGQRQQLMRPRILEDRKLKEINLDFLKRLEDALPKNDRTRLHDEFFKRSYPKVCSDLSPEYAIESIMRAHDITDDQRAALEALAQQIRQDYRKASVEMEEHVTHWMERRLGGGEVHVDEIAEYESVLNTMKAKRARLQSVAMKHMTDLLTQEQRESLPKAHQAVSGDKSAASAPEDKTPLPD